MLLADDITTSAKEFTIQSRRVVTSGRSMARRVRGEGQRRETPLKNYVIACRECFLCLLALKLVNSRSFQILLHVWWYWALCKPDISFCVFCHVKFYVRGLRSLYRFTMHVNNIMIYFVGIQYCIPQVASLAAPQCTYLLQFLFALTKYIFYLFKLEYREVLIMERNCATVSDIEGLRS